MSGKSKKEQKPETKFPSELRFDLVSKDWVVIAKGRAKRPEKFKKEQNKEKDDSQSLCQFCDINELEKPILILKDGKKIQLSDKDSEKWTLLVVANKYPAFFPSDYLNERKEGPYITIDGVGFHEVVITREHNRKIAQLEIGQIKELVSAFQYRYLDLMNRKNVNYVSIFHNSSKESGASIPHPHSQIIAIPLIDPDLLSSIRGSEQFFKKQKKCVHCTMLQWDKKDGRRIVFENKEFLVVVPFASRIAFETRIYPKEHGGYFEKITEKQKDYFAQALKVALDKIYKVLNDPPYNFFIHTAPCDGKDYSHYHWHLEILPKTSTWAGFELGAGIEISTIDPETAAKYLREQK